jgi:hypothetical protein
MLRSHVDRLNEGIVLRTSRGGKIGEGDHGLVGSPAAFHPSNPCVVYVLWLNASAFGAREYRV